MSRAVTLPILLAVVLTACADPSPTLPLPSAPRRSTDPAAAGDAPALAVRGTFAGEETASPLSPTAVGVHLTGGGVAAHLGRYSVVLDAVVQLPSGTSAVDVVFRAANGDELWGSGTGAAAPSPTRPGFLSITETGVITGGSGRFAGATGSFTLVRLYDAATAASTGTVDASITVAR